MLSTLRQGQLLHDVRLERGVVEMPKQSQAVESSELVQAILSVHLAEYNAMRSELLEMEKAQSQLVLYALVSVGAAIPILLDLVQDQMWISLLLVPIVFSGIAWVYLGYIGLMYRTAIYLHTHLRPAIDTLLRQIPSGSGLEFEILAWERFAREKGLNVLTWPKGFEMFLFVLPSVICVVAYLASQGGNGNKTDQYAWLVILDSVMMVGTIAAGLLINLVALCKLKVSR